MLAMEKIGHELKDAVLKKEPTFAGSHALTRENYLSAVIRR